MPKKLAPKPAAKAAPVATPKKPAAGETSTPEAKRDGFAWQRLEASKNEALKQLHLAQQKQAETEQKLRASQDTAALLRAGLDPHWTDQAVLHAFGQAQIHDGPLGAVMAVLQRQIDQAHADAEALEEAGKRDAVPAIVGAARRLNHVRSEIIALYNEANALAGYEPGKRASQFPKD